MKKLGSSALVVIPPTVSTFTPVPSSNVGPSFTSAATVVESTPQPFRQPNFSSAIRTDSGKRRVEEVGRFVKVPGGRTWDRLSGGWV